MSNINLVKNFLAAIHINNKEDLLSFFDDQSVFTNIPMGTVTGREGVWEILGPLHEKADSVEYILHNISESDSGVVLTERTDRYIIDGKVADFPVMGAFVVEGDKIREWRDYFDLAQCLEQLPEGAASPI